MPIEQNIVAIAEARTSIKIAKTVTLNDTSLIAASAASPNPVRIGSAIHLVTEIYEQC